MKFEHKIKKEEVIAVQEKFYRKESILVLLNGAVNKLAGDILAEKAIDAQIKFDVELTNLMKGLLGDLFDTFKCSYGVDFDTNIAWLETEDIRFCEKLLAIGFTKK